MLSNMKFWLHFAAWSVNSKIYTLVDICRFSIQMLLLHLWNLNMVFIQNEANSLWTFKREPTFKLYVKSKCFT